MKYIELYDSTQINKNGEILTRLIILVFQFIFYSASGEVTQLFQEKVLYKPLRHYV